MKRLIAGALALAAGAAGGQAIAADLPQPPPRAPAAYIPPPPPFSWTGFYLGVNGGYAFGQSNWSGTAGSTGNFNTNGGLVGGTVGANYQFSPWFVAGVEGDIDWTSIKGSIANPTGTTICGTGAGVGFAASSCQTQNNWLATARGRAGVAFDRLLVFGTGGAAFGNIKTGLSSAGFDTTTKVGWTAGAGVEYALTPNWTAKVEYLFVDLQNATCTTVANCGNAAGSNVSLKENLVRGGVNFKF